MALRSKYEMDDDMFDGPDTSVLGGSTHSPPHPPGLNSEDDGEVGRTYVTVSQAANEKVAQAHTRVEKANGI